MGNLLVNDSMNRVQQGSRFAQESLQKEQGDRQAVTQSQSQSQAQKEETVQKGSDPQASADREADGQKHEKKKGKKSNETPMLEARKKLRNKLMGGSLIDVDA